MRPHSWEMAHRDLDPGHVHLSGTLTPSSVEVQRIWVGTGAEGSGTEGGEGTPRERAERPFIQESQEWGRIYAVSGVPLFNMRIRERHVLLGHVYPASLIKRKTLNQKHDLLQDLSQH